MKGIERSVDKLGRIVLPKKYREKLGLKTDDKVIISLDDGELTVSPVKCICIMCNRTLSIPNSIRICQTCINIIKANENGQ